MRKLLKTSLIVILIFFILLSTFCPMALSSRKFNSIDIDKLEFKQELMIPIDTSLEIAKFQPIDIRLVFSNPCWVKDETHHSVRIAFDDGSGLTEVDSQIYDFEFTDENHIKSCSLVFLIPEKANGKEKYYAFYDSSEVESANYDDHIVIEDTHYFYEPISGQKINFDYYGVIEDGFVIYAAIQKGEIIGNPVSHTIAKCIPKATVMETSTIEQLGTFDLRYGIKGTPDYTGPSATTKVTKNVLVDGNLMVRFRIECTSPHGNLRTDNIYTYYYCPTDTKRIYANINHEVLKTVDIEDPDVLDGAYAGIVTIKSRSTTIDKMNVGNILPIINLYDEDETIKEYSVPSDPDSIKKEIILSTEDDVDLGSRGWISLNDPETGKVHGLIMESNTGFVEGEEDGLQIKAYVKQNIKLPGLEGDTGSVFLGRNAYEKGGSHTTTLPEGFQVRFSSVFITDENEGYKRINLESEIYQKLIEFTPVFRENVSKGDEEKERFTLTTFVHLAPSAPMGSLLSAALGRNIPYIHAELYKENIFKSSGSASRISLGAIDLDLEDKSITQILKTVLGLFDWKSASLFKKIKFPDLESGIYVVKIFRENLLLGRNRQYIGFKIIDLKSNEKVHIYCRSQGKIKLSITDQNDNAVENVKFLLERDNISIADVLSDRNGTAILYAPCYPSKAYNLRVIYQGFLIDEMKVRFGLLNRLIRLKESFSMEQYNLNLKIKDKWGFAPAVEVNPILTSDEMVEPILLSAYKEDDGKYSFSNLLPTEYTLNMGYKSFEIDKEISIDKDKTVDIEFPAEYEIDFTVMNSYGYLLSDGEVTISRSGKVEKTSIDRDGIAKFNIPPGEYKVTIYSRDEEIAKQEIDIRSGKEIDVITSQESIFHIIITYVGIAIVALSILFMFLRKNFYIGMKLLAIGLLIIALVSPWWSLNGDNGTTSTNTRTLLYPPRIVTLSYSSEVLGGDVSQVPLEVTMVLELLSILIIVSCLSIFITIFTKTKLRKTTMIFSILSIVFLIFTTLIFFYVMGQITEVGVGSFIGSGDIDTSFPGIAESKIIPSNWGPDIGFYLSIFVAFYLIILSVQERIKKGGLKKNHIP